jgi:pyruvate/2-oxoglutarate dehydrogenase complex dihydrolipoamide dehydrogenase (E3) component
LVEASLRTEGVDVRTSHKAVHFDGKGKLVITGLKIESTLEYDDIIIAVGRRARVSGFGLEELGLVKDGRLLVDEYLTTAMPHIKVAGDVAGNQQLTHGASHEAWYATVNALAAPFKRYKADYRVLPRVTYTDPEVATVGLTEAEASELGLAYDITRYDLDDLDRAIADGEARGFVKILTAPGKDRILGATIVGSHAGEIIAELVLAMKHNMGLRKIMQAVHSYPTWAEASKYAAGQYGLARQPVRLQRLAKCWFDWRRG